MRQDVMTAVSAIRANEEESETQHSDRVQVLTKQMLLQKDKFKVQHFISSYSFIHFYRQMVFPIHVPCLIVGYMIGILLQIYTSCSFFPLKMEN